MNKRLDIQVEALLKDAKKEAKEIGNRYLGSEHVLLAILHNHSTTLAKELSKKGVHYDRMKQDIQVLFGANQSYDGEIEKTQVVEEILEKSIQMADERNEGKVDLDLFIEALLDTQDCVARELLHRYDIDYEDVLQHVQQVGWKMLDRCSELRRMYEKGKDVQLYGREQALCMMSAVLSRKEKANPMLIGEAGVGKSALVEKLAYMVENEEIEMLKGCRIYELNLNALVAGTRYRGDFEEKLQNLMDVIEQTPNVIVFIDEIHQMIGAGKSEGSIDVASVLKPYLARSSIRCIGATTLEEYTRYIEQDRALERRFHIIELKEPTIEETKAILIGKKEVYEQFHKVKIDENSMTTIIQKCERYMGNRKFPDKAFDVLDLACVKATTQKGIVDSEIVTRVVEEITGIYKKDKQQLMQVKQHVMQGMLYPQEDVMEKLMRQLYWIQQDVLSSSPLGVWLVCGKEGSGKMSWIRSFHASYFPNTPMVEVDMIQGFEQLETAISMIRRTMNTTICIKNIHKANLRQLWFWKEAIEKAELSYGFKKVSIKQCIMIFHMDEACQYSHNFLKAKDDIKVSLPKEFMHIFDEVFLFQNLQLTQKKEIAMKLLKNWNVCMNVDDIETLVTSTHTLEELKTVLKNHVIDQVYS